MDRASLYYNNYSYQNSKGWTGLFKNPDDIIYWVSSKSPRLSQNQQSWIAAWHCDMKKKNKLVFAHLKMTNWYKWYNNFITINHFVLFHKITKSILTYLIILNYMKFKNAKLQWGYWIKNNAPSAYNVINDDDDDDEWMNWTYKIRTFF